MATEGRLLPCEDRVRILKMRECGQSIRRIAAEVGCSPVTVMKVIGTLGTGGSRNRKKSICKV